jgi:hypothetical protein
MEAFLVELRPPALNFRDSTKEAVMNQRKGAALEGTWENQAFT